jgi:hypothetical protein
MIIVGRNQGRYYESWRIEAMETINVIKELCESLEGLVCRTMTGPAHSQISAKEPFELGLALKYILGRKGYRRNTEFLIHFYQIRKLGLPLWELHGWKKD